MTLSLCLRSPGSLTKEPWLSIWRDPRVKLLLATTNTRSTYDMIRNDRPDLPWWAVSDLCFAQCRTSGSEWTGWLNLPDSRYLVSPDGYMSHIYEEQFGGGWNGFWTGERGKFVVGQANDIVTSPEKKMVRGFFRRTTNIEAWAVAYKWFVDNPPGPCIYDGIAIDMTPWHLSGAKYKGYLTPGSFDLYKAFALGLRTVGVPFLENSFGAGPNASGQANGFILERTFNQLGGINVTGTYWDYIARITRDGIEGGLASLTPEQRSKSVLCIQPSKSWTAEDRYEHAKCGLATALLMDVGYVSPFNRWDAENASGWDPDEFAQWLDLEPAGPTEVAVYGTGWTPWSHWAYVDVRVMAANAGPLRRRLQDSAGRKYNLWMTPNNVARYGMAPQSAKLVRLRGRSE